MESKTKKQTIEKPSLLYYDVKLLPEEQIGLHKQNSWELSYIITGKGRRYIGDTSEQFTRGEIVLIPPNIPHCWYFDNTDIDSDGRIANITIVFEDYALERISQAFPELSKEISTFRNRSNAIKLEDSILSYIKSILEEMRSESNAQRLGSFVQIIIELSNILSDRKNPQKDKIDRKLYLYLSFVLLMMNYFKTHREISFYAQKLNISSTYLSRIIKTLTGNTVMDFIDQMLLVEALYLLSETRVSIQEVADKLNFSDQAAFNKFIRRQINQSQSDTRDNRYIKSSTNNFVIFLSINILNNE